MKRPVHRARLAQGFTLVGTMVGVALAMLASLAALATFQVTRDAYASVADSVLIEERGLRALSILSHAIRHAGWTPEFSTVSSAQTAPDAVIAGLDDCAQPSAGAPMQCARSGVSHSDALMVRLLGSGLPDDPTLPDGLMSDCGGYALPARAIGTADAADAAAPRHAATNLFYVGMAADGVPQLLCRYPTRQDGRVQAGTYTSGALIRGVEALQLRYGIDRDGNGSVDQFVPARTLQTREASAWHRVRAVQVAVVVRGEHPTMLSATPTRLPMLPASSEGEHADDLSFQPSQKLRVRRRVFATTIRLRNALSCGEAAC